MRPTLPLLRVVVRAGGQAFSARLLGPWTALAFLLAQFWSVLPWGRIQGALAGAGAVERAAVATVLLAAAMGLARPALAASWGARGVRAALRQPVGGVARSVALLPLAVVASAPALGSAVLFPGSALPRLLTWALLAAPLAAGGRSLLLVPVALLAGEAGAWPVAWVVAWVALRRTGEAWLSVERTSAPTALPGPRGPLSALLWRDAACLVRRDPGVLALGLAGAVVSSGLLLGLRVNGGLAGDALATAACVLLLAVSPVGATALGRLVARQGARLDPSSWPVGPRVRASMLALVAAGTLLPTGVAMAATGPALGIWGWARVGVAGTAACAGASAVATGALVLVGRSLRPGPVNIGVFLGLALVLLGLSIAATPQGVALQAAIGAAALELAARRLERRRRR